MSGLARIHDTLERLERWLREHQPAFLDALRPGATDTELDDLERAINRELPEDVRAFYRWRNGIAKADHLDEGWYAGPEGPFSGRPMTLAEIPDEYCTCCGLGQHHWNTPETPGWWHDGWVPLFDINFGPLLLCVDTAGVWTGTRGQIVWFDNKSEYRTIYAASLGDYLRGLVIGLERGITKCSEAESDSRLLSPFGYPKNHDATEAPVIPDPPTPPAPIAKPSRPSFQTGDTVRIVDGAFANTEGQIRLHAGTWRVTTRLVFWGRPLDVELEPHQVQLAECGPQVLVSAWTEGTDAAELFTLLGFSPTVRKLQLLVAACYRARLDPSVEVDALCCAIEDFAGDSIDALTLRGAIEDFWLHTRDLTMSPPDGFTSLYRAAESGSIESLAPEAVQQNGTPNLVREIFLNPFAPQPRFEPSWRTTDVLAVARGIYDGRAFEGLPVLADALQEAGCDNDELLNHLRDTSHAHVRGCWALDLCLGLE